MLFLVFVVLLVREYRAERQQSYESYQPTLAQKRWQAVRLRDRCNDPDPTEQITKNRLIGE
jgi:hypothetical protein